MTRIFTIAGTIFALISTGFFREDFKQLGLLFLILAIGLYLYALLVYIKELKAKKESHSLSGLKLDSYSTDENTKLVIKSIGTAETGSINFNEIVNYTNLQLKAINKILDWLVIHKLATENKGRRGKVYELTPKGRNLFNTIEASRKAYYKHIKESNEAMPDRESSQFDDIP